jgi:hypothetical protein
VYFIEADSGNRSHTNLVEDVLKCTGFLGVVLAKHTAEQSEILHIKHFHWLGIADVTYQVAKKFAPICFAVLSTGKWKLHNCQDTSRVVGNLLQLDETKTGKGIYLSNAMTHRNGATQGRARHGNQAWKFVHAIGLYGERLTVYLYVMGHYDVRSYYEQLSHFGLFM